MTTPTTTRHLIARYGALLLDSYGVLIDGSGLLPGAPALLDHLQRHAVPFLVVTNDASRLPETRAARYRDLGLPIAPHQILTSGALLQPWFHEHSLAGQRCVVLGPEDSHRYIEQAGGIPVPPGDDRAQIIAACDDAGFPLLDAVEAVLSQIFRAIDRGHPPRLVLPNPDLLYPKSPGQYGLTSGSIALLLEASIQTRYPGHPLRFEPLGKPTPRIFQAALARLPSPHAVMIGDQLATDILGASRAGLDSALVTSGVTPLEALGPHAPATPTWTLPSLDPHAPTPNPGPLRAARLLVQGRVQGVSYRAHTQRQALALGITGEVQNLPDGAVCATLQGHQHDLDAMIAWCRRGPPHALVTHLTQEPIETAPRQGFHVTR